jgi:hypothetical protein
MTDQKQTPVADVSGAFRGLWVKVGGVRSEKSFEMLLPINRYSPRYLPVR